MEDKEALSGKDVYIENGTIYLSSALIDSTELSSPIDFEDLDEELVDLDRDIVGAEELLNFATYQLNSGMSMQKEFDQRTADVSRLHARKAVLDYAIEQMVHEGTKAFLERQENAV